MDKKIPKGAACPCCKRPARQNTTSGYVCYDYPDCDDLLNLAFCTIFSKKGCPNCGANGLCTDNCATPPKITPPQK